MEEILRKQPPELPPSPPPANYQHGYFKENWKKMLLIYVVIGLFIYGAAYYFLIVNQKSNPYIQSVTKTISPTPTPTIQNTDYKSSCEQKGGKWLEKYKECESEESDKGLDQNACTALGGTFKGCDSACRNNPNAEVCITVCVKTCKFN